MRKLRLTALVTAVCLSLAVTVSASGVPAAQSKASPLWKMQHFSATASPKGYSPSKIKTAYGYSDSIGTGSGKTIALITAYGNPNLKNDMAVFDQAFGLEDAALTVYDSGVTEKDSGWALETSLDAEWAHAMAPDAKLLVVAAKSDSSSDLLSTVDYAVAKGANIVSMSWGSNEDLSQIFVDNHFINKNVVFLAASGDEGAGAMWPASSPNVISVGGTTLTLAQDGSIASETAWSESGGGKSTFEAEPYWQQKMGIRSRTRIAPDVSFDADPLSGVSVYCSVKSSKKGWYKVGGTSLGTPVWAGITADLNQSAAYIKNVGSLYTLAGGTSYTNSGNCFYDITSGDNGGYGAASGYDAVTGLGSPNIANLAAQAKKDASLLSSQQNLRPQPIRRPASKSSRSWVFGY